MGENENVASLNSLNWPYLWPRKLFFQIFLVEIIIPHHREDPNLKLSDQDPHNSDHQHNNNNLDHNLKIDLILNKHSDNLLHKRHLGGLSLNLKQGPKNLKRLLYREMVLKVCSSLRNHDHQIILNLKHASEYFLEYCQ